MCRDGGKGVCVEPLRPGGGGEGCVHCGRVRKAGQRLRGKTRGRSEGGGDGASAGWALHRRL